MLLGLWYNTAACSNYKIIWYFNNHIFELNYVYTNLTWKGKSRTEKNNNESKHELFKGMIKCLFTGSTLQYHQRDHGGSPVGDHVLYGYCRVEDMEIVLVEIYGCGVGDTFDLKTNTFPIKVKSVRSICLLNLWLKFSLT